MRNYHQFPVLVVLVWFKNTESRFLRLNLYFIAFNLKRYGLRALGLQIKDIWTIQITRDIVIRSKRCIAEYADFIGSNVSNLTNEILWFRIFHIYSICRWWALNPYYYNLKSKTFQCTGRIMSLFSNYDPHQNNFDEFICRRKHWLKWHAISNRYSRCISIINVKMTVEYCSPSLMNFQQASNDEFSNTTKMLQI
jgi:hypothetical protein